MSLGSSGCDSFSGLYFFFMALSYASQVFADVQNRIWVQDKDPKMPHTNPSDKTAGKVR